ncbi:cytochrome P450 [Mycena maculata]|uniref:Cytochrome P450 n=1 Tax=Mycena maculata TaxID=230809 RepID=A0AAD7K8S2_9AGAR|nr:cytochrome P450 [Mycena maculata]
MDIDSKTYIGLPVVCLTTFILFRIFFDKLSVYPGPWTARVTKGYRFYYDVVQSGGLLDELHRLHKKFGLVVRIGPNELHFSDPKAFFDIYSHSNLTKEPTLYNSFPFHEASISYIDPVDASTRRDLLNPMFSRSSILKLQPVIQGKIDKLISRISTSHDEGNCKPIDMHMAYRSATMDIITSYCFADTFDALDAPGFRHPILVGLQTGVTSSWILKYMPWMLHAIENAPDWMVDCLPREHQFFRDLRQFSSSQIDGYALDPTLLDRADQPTIFHQLMVPNIKAQGHVPSRRSLMGETMALLAAGHDTVGGVCTVGTFHILKNPAVHTQLVEELREVWPDVDSPMGYQRLEKLTYLTAVVKESLRLAHGIVSNLPRVTGVDMQIGDHYVPKNTVVSMSVIFMHLNPDIFPEPERFDPDRWLRASSERLSDMNNNLWPFSRGSRMCLGITLAWCELYLIFAHIFRRTNMELSNASEHDYTTFRDFFVPVWDGNRLHVVVKGVEGSVE